MYTMLKDMGIEITAEQIEPIAIKMWKNLKQRKQLRSEWKERVRDCDYKGGLGDYVWHAAICELGLQIVEDMSDEEYDQRKQMACA